MTNDYEYFRRKRTDKTYVSKRIPGTEEEGVPARALRIASKVFDPAESHSFVKELDELVVHISPGRRYQIKATFYEDDKGISCLTIQRFTIRDGKPHDMHFSFGPDEISGLLKFIANLQRMLFTSEVGINVKDTDLERMLLSSDQVRRLIRENQSLVLELARSEITTSEVVAFGYRKRQLERFHKLLFDPDYFKEQKSSLKKTDEALWQAFFEENKWIFGYGLTYLFLSSLEDRKLEQIVAGTDVWDRGKRADALMKSRGAIEALCFVEIKKHTTGLLKNSTYRPGCWAPSDELTGGIAQSQATVANALKKIVEKYEPSDENGNPTGEQLFAYHPRSFLVVGSLSEFNAEKGLNIEKYRSFELYRRNTSSPEVITFDELYERAKFIVECAEK